MLLHTAKLADWYLSQAHSALAQGDFVEAKTNAKAAIKLAPRYFKAYNTLGICFGYANDFASAIACFDKSIELKPNQTEAQINRITALMMQGERARLNELGGPTPVIDKSSEYV
jgi:tetratricopeptide (TPR) repeat protein